MSGKMKKTSENLSFSMSRWFRRATTNAPTTFLITVLALGYTLFLFGGGLFTLINNPLPAYVGDGGNTILFLAPGISNQFGADTFISVSLYALGLVGLLAIYQSSKNAYKPRQAYMLLIVGIALLLISYIFLEGSINFKQSYSG
jgi:hypothetical protein